MTLFIRPVFTVKESASGSPSIALEYEQSDANFPAGSFGLSLQAGTTLAEAQRIAGILNGVVAEFTYTE